MAALIENGIHLLSGVGHTEIFDDWSGEGIDVDLFCIDGVTYGAFIDPCDGWRSYGVIKEVSNKCQYTFPPQEVEVANYKIVEEATEENWYGKDIQKLIIRDAVNGKEVLVVGTDLSDGYYPMAIFNYTPENLQINANR